MDLSDPKLRYGLRVAIAPWIIFVAGLALEWNLSFVGAVFTALFILGQKPVPFKYGVSLTIAGYAYMILAWYISMFLKPYPAAFLLAILVAVALSYYLLLKSHDILMTVMALLGALLIPLMIKSSPDTAWQLALWIPHNLLIAFLVSIIIFKVLPPDNADTTASNKDILDFDLARRWQRLCIVFIPFVIYAFVTDNISAFTLTFLSVQVTQFAILNNNGTAMIKAAMWGNILGGALAVIVYELAVIAPFFPTICLTLFIAYLLLAQKLLQGHVIATTAMTAFTVVCGVSFGQILDDAGGKISLRLLQISFCLAYIFIAMYFVNRYLPEKKATN